MESFYFKFSNLLLLVYILFLIHVRTVGAADWDVFTASHIFDPKDPSHAGFQNWSAERWIAWLDHQEIKRADANRGFGVPLPNKPLNTVIIASPEDVLKAFDPHFGLTPPYHTSRGGAFWSNRKFPSIVFETRNPGRPFSITRVFLTPDLYIAATLNEWGQPVHLATMFDSRYPAGNAKFPYRQEGIELR